MRIEELPRPSDEDRAALDDLVVQRGVALKAMRDAGNDWSAFSAASKREADLAARIRRLRNVTSGIAVALFLSGCSLTPTQQKWAGFAAGVLVVGAIAAHDADNGKPLAPVNKKRPFNPCPGGVPQDCK